MPRRKKRAPKRKAHFLPFHWDGLEQTLGSLEKQVRFYADGLVHTLSHAEELLPNKAKLMREAKKNLNQFMRKVRKSNMTHLAKNLAHSNGQKLLALLDFPTKKDVARLNARLSKLEKRFKSRPSRPSMV